MERGHKALRMVLPFKGETSGFVGVIAWTNAYLARFRIETGLSGHDNKLVNSELTAILESGLSFSSFLIDSFPKLKHVIASERK